jgi:hypothetical protein
VTPNVTRVPLLVSAAGVQGGTWSDEMACGIDVAPTLLALAGLGVPAEMEGRPLLPEGGPAPAERSCRYLGLQPASVAEQRADGRTLVMELPTGSSAGPRFWSFDRGRDPDALRPGPVPDRQQAALAAYLERIRERQRARPAVAAEPTDAALIEQLRALGYVQ